MKRIGQALFVVSLLFVVGSGAIRIYGHFARPALFYPNETVDLGTVAGGRDPVATFRVVNRGYADLVVKSVIPGCGACLRVDRFPSSPLLPGDSAEIKVVLLTKGVSGPVKKVVVVESNDPSRSRVKLWVRANVAPAAPKDG